MVGLLGSLGLVQIALAFIAIYTIYHVANTVHNAFFGPLSSVPGPKIRALSIIPHARTVMRGEQHRDNARLHQQYGPVVRVGPHHLSYASGAPAWKDIHGFRKGGIIPKDKQFYGVGINAVQSIIEADDTSHARQRKILSHAFSDRALREQEPLIKSWAAKLSSKLAERAAQGDKADMLKFYNLTTFDIMGDLTFGEGLNMLEDSEYTPWVATIFNGIKVATVMRGLKYLGPAARYLIDELLMKSKPVKKAMLANYNYSVERVDKRLARTPDHPDLWTIIMGKDEEHGGLTPDEHHSNGNIFMIAGTETTATALSGVTYRLLTNPDVLAELTAEIRGACSTTDDLTMETLARLKYLNAVLQEGLRMYPPVPIELPRRVAKGGVVVDGRWLPEDTVLGISQYATHHLEAHFKKPYEFHPERWLGDPDFKDDRLSALEPFSVGPRNCLGKVRRPRR